MKSSRLSSSQYQTDVIGVYDVQGGQLEGSKVSQKFIDSEMNSMSTDMYNTDPDALSLHRRKMMRRAANRRSAQLSRARKKSHMQELQAENARLHRLLDIFDSQPDYVFCATADGKITFVNDKLANVNFSDSTNTGSSNEGSGDGNSSFVSQILDKESCKAFSQMVSVARRPFNRFTELESDVRQVYLKSCEQPLEEGMGYGCMRVSRVTRRPSNLVDIDTMNYQSSSPRNDAEKSPVLKKLKVGDSKHPYISAQSLEDAAAVLSALTGLASGSLGNEEDSSLAQQIKEEDNEGDAASHSSANSSSNNIVDQTTTTMTTTTTTITTTQNSRPTRVSAAGRPQRSTSTVGLSPGLISNLNDKDNSGTEPSNAPIEDEFVCVIRPAKYCVPAYDSNLPPLLSRASMSAHNAGNPTNKNVSLPHATNHNRKRSCSGSSDMEDDNDSSPPSSSGDSGGHTTLGGNSSSTTYEGEYDQSGNNTE
jgi:hypothetical protein